MNKKTTILILVSALLLGLVTALAVYSYVQRVQQDVERNRRDVVVAALAIKPRTVIRADMLTIQRVPVDRVADHAATQIDAVVGKVSLEGYKKEDQIRMTDLAARDKVPGLAYVIPDGKRAVTIRVDEVKGVGYSVHPGDHVDILATYRDPVTGQQLTQIILQRLEVLAIDAAQMDSAKGGKGASTSVTFAVTPEEATKLTVTDSEGALRMMLRPEDDKGVVDLKAIKLRDLVKPQMVDTDSVVVAQTNANQMPIGDKEPPKVKVFKGSEPMKEVSVGE